MGKVERRSRPDRATAAAVDAGILICQACGPRAAALEMERNGVNFRVIVRSLSEPGRRRPVSEKSPATLAYTEYHRH